METIQSNFTLVEVTSKKTQGFSTPGDATVDSPLHFLIIS